MAFDRNTLSKSKIIYVYFKIERNLMRYVMKKYLKKIIRKISRLPVIRQLTYFLVTAATNSENINTINLKLENIISEKNMIQLQLDEAISKQEKLNKACENIIISIPVVLRKITQDINKLEAYIENSRITTSKLMHDEITLKQ